MNGVAHFYLRGAAAPLPERWSEAFAQGRVLDATALLAWLRGHSVVHDIIWLSTTDALWPTHLQQILRAEPAARVVLLSSAPQPQEGLEAINAGVRGYTHNYAVPALLKEVALVVEHGGLWVGADLLQRLVGSTQTALSSRSAPASTPLTQGALAALSAREAEVARAVSAGHSNREVAELLHISERTVKAHLGMVFEKLAVRDRLQLVLRLAGSAGPGSSSPTHPLP